MITDAQREIWQHEIWQREPWQLGSWLVQPTLNTIRRGDETRQLGPKVMTVLVCLAEKAGEPVSRDELIERVWEGRFTSDESVTTMLYELRKALDDRAGQRRYIGTVRQRGYRLLVPAVPCATEDPVPLDVSRPLDTPDRTVKAPRPGLRARGLFLAPLAAGLILAFSSVLYWGTAAERSAVPATTASSEIEEALHLGRYFLAQGTAPSSTQARAYFERALAIAPDFAAAHAALADTYLALAEHLPASAQAQAYSQALQAAETALALESELPQAHVTRASITFLHHWDWQLAGEQFLRGAPYSRSVDGSRRYAEYLAAMGRHDEAIITLKTGLKSDPASKTGRWGMARIYYLARRYDEALAELEIARQLDPDYAPVSRLANDIFLATGQSQEALRACVETLELAGSDAVDVAVLTEAFDVEGIHGVLRCLVEWANQKSLTGAADPVWLAGLEARRGDTEAALAWLERAYEERHGELVWINVEPAFDALRSTDRFRALVGRLGLGA